MARGEEVAESDVDLMVVGKIGLDANLGMDTVSQDGKDVFNKITQRKGPRLVLPFAGVGEELAGELRHPERRGLYGFQVVSCLVIAPQFQVEQVKVADDAGEGIVELMGDPGGESGDRLHLASLFELSPKPPSLRQVDKHG